jgi:hypothetical protein
MSARVERGSAAVRVAASPAGLVWLPSRRWFLKTGAITGAGVLALGCGSPGQPAADAGLPDAAEPDGPPVVDPGDDVGEPMLSPEETGTLAEVEVAALWALFEQIGQRWQNGSHCLIDRQEALAEILALKTQQVPSYYAEYRLATEVLNAIAQQQGADQVLEAVLAFPTDAPATVGGHVRTYTLSEFLRLQVTQGGFRVLDYRNYPGFEGGTMEDPKNLPYRPWEG